MTTNEVPVYVVWWSDGEQDFEPVYAAGNEAEAAEYVYEREDDYNFYQITNAYSKRPVLETLPEEDEE